MKLDNGGNIVDASQVTVCNNLIHSLFKQINVRLNGTLISPQTDTYHHKAFIDTVIHYFFFFTFYCFAQTQETIPHTTVPKTILLTIPRVIEATKNT